MRTATEPLQFGIILKFSVFFSTAMLVAMRYKTIVDLMSQNIGMTTDLNNMVLKETKMGLCPAILQNIELIY